MGEKMNRWILLFGTLCLVTAVILILWNLRRTRKTMETIEQMLNAWRIVLAEEGINADVA